MGFPGSSAGKESACNARDPSLIPESGRSPGEGMGYPLQYSWTSLVAQTVKKLPAMLETWLWSLGWEDPLGEGMATHCSILAWRIPMNRGAWRAAVRGVAKSWTQLKRLSMHAPRALNILKMNTEGLTLRHGTFTTIWNLLGKKIQLAFPGWNPSLGLPSDFHSL